MVLRLPGITVHTQHIRQVIICTHQTLLSHCPHPTYQADYHLYSPDPTFSLSTPNTSGRLSSVLTRPCFLTVHTQHTRRIIICTHQTLLSHCPHPAHQADYHLYSTDSAFSLSTPNTSGRSSSVLTRPSFLTVHTQHTRQIIICTHQTAFSLSTPNTPGGLSSVLTRPCFLTVHTQHIRQVIICTHQTLLSHCPHPTHQAGHHLYSPDSAFSLSTPNTSGRLSSVLTRPCFLTVHTQHTRQIIICTQQTLLSHCPHPAHQAGHHLYSTDSAFSLSTPNTPGRSSSVLTRLCFLTVHTQHTRRIIICTHQTLLSHCPHPTHQADYHLYSTDSAFSLSTSSTSGRSSSVLNKLCFLTVHTQHTRQVIICTHQTLFSHCPYPTHQADYHLYSPDSAFSLSTPNTPGRLSSVLTRPCFLTVHTQHTRQIIICTHQTMLFHCPHPTHQADYHLYSPDSAFSLSTPNTPGRLSSVLTRPCILTVHTQHTRQVIICTQQPLLSHCPHPTHQPDYHLYLPDSAFSLSTPNTSGRLSSELNRPCFLTVHTQHTRQIIICTHQTLLSHCPHPTHQADYHLYSTDSAFSLSTPSTSGRSSSVLTRPCFLTVHNQHTRRIIICTHQTLLSHCPHPAHQADYHLYLTNSAFSLSLPNTSGRSSSVLTGPCFLIVHTQHIR